MMGVVGAVCEVGRVWMWWELVACLGDCVVLGGVFYVVWADEIGGVSGVMLRRRIWK